MSENYKEVWQFAKDQIHNEYIENGQEAEFNLWFKMDYEEDNANVITVSVPSDFLWQSMLKKGNVKLLCNRIEELTGQQIQIIPNIKNGINSSAKPITSFTAPKETEPESPKVNKTEFKIPNFFESSLLNEKINKKNDSNSQPQIDEIEAYRSRQLKEISASKNTKSNPTLDEKFTFDSFVAGDGSASKFAYNIARTVAENPGKKYNPILFYGGVGLGKTHLMQAIGNHIDSTYGADKKICYIQAESFLNEFTKSIVSQTQEKFKSKYRNLDVLLIDDIQFFQGKEGIQTELFYTFEALYKKQAQMVFTCDRPLKEIENMTSRLISRLGQGMMLDLQPPNFETRKAIILKKLEINNKILSSEVIDYIAKAIQTNIRDLESALNKIIGYADILETNITLDVVKELLNDFYNSPSVGNVSIENIIKVVSDNFYISITELKGKKRIKNVNDARQIALYISKEITEYTYSDLGVEFGGRDHSTIMHAVEKIKEQIKIDPSLSQKIESLIKEIKEYKN